MGLSIIIPAHNEEETIGNTLFSIMRGLVKIGKYEIIVVNDHSSDKTVDIVNDIGRISNNKIRLINNEYQAGFAHALLTGFQASSFEVVIPVMADLCDDISTIELMSEKLVKGFDVVCGTRYIKGGQRLGGSKLKAFFSWFVGQSIYFFTQIPTHDISNAFKMYRKEVIDNINIESRGFEISTEITLKAYFKGYKISEVPTVWKERTEGKSSFNIWKVLPHYLHWYLWAIGRRIIYIFS